MLFAAILPINDLNSAKNIYDFHFASVILKMKFFLKAGIT